MIATDNVGNREANKVVAENTTTLSPTSISTCPGENIKITANSFGSGFIYQWQVNKGQGFTILSDDTIYANTNSKELSLINPPSSMYGYQFRCVGINGSTINTSKTWDIKFSNTWAGTVSTAWENPANWTCNRIPDEFVDVIVSYTFNAPLVNSHAACRGLKLLNGAVCNVNPAFSLEIKGKK